jgi:hypothetical protein
MSIWKLSWWDVAMFWMSAAMFCWDEEMDDSRDVCRDFVGEAAGVFWDRSAKGVRGGGGAWPEGAAVRRRGAAEREEG